MNVPPDLYGRGHPDRLMRPLRLAAAAYVRLSRLSGRRRPPVQPVDRNLPLVVSDVRTEASDVVSVRMVRADGGPLPAWQPGCHLDVLLPSGLRRQYSLCGDPRDAGEYRIAVRRIGAGSGEVHSLRKGSAITVQGPRNAFPFVEADRYLFIAGGIGITPILPMVRAARRRGAECRLVYTGRARESLPFLDEVGAAEVRTDDVDGVPSGAELVGAAGDAVVYCCGPIALIDAVRAQHPGTVHFERFSPPPVVDGRPFEVELRRSGQVLDVPADRTLLEVVRDAVPGVAYSCRQGFCGTCRAAVLDGEPEHRDRNPAEKGDTMLICVSRATTARLVLDL